MADSLRINDFGIGPSPIGPAPPPRTATREQSGPSFAEVLKQTQTGQAQPLKFSAHAQTRIESRQIELSPTDVARLNGAVQKAAGKGSQESLVLLDQTAFVVSVPNRTVITVVDQPNLKENVFTNIDSAVIA